MKQHTKWVAAAVAVTGGLAFFSSAQAQPVTGDATLDNVTPTAAYANWGNSPPTIISDGPAGLNIFSLGYGSLYYSIPTAQQQTITTTDDQATLVMTVNNPVSPPSSTYWLGLPFILDDNVASVTYGGYLGEFGYFGAFSPAKVSWNGDTVTETVPLAANQLATIEAGGDVINGFNLELDPAVNPGGVYNVTFDSLTLSTPDASTTMPLLASVATALMVFRGRKNNK